MKKNFTLGLAAIFVVSGFSAPALAASHLGSYETELKDACVANSDIPDAVCSCIAKAATAEAIDDAQREWIMLAASGSSKSAAGMGTMSAEQAAAATDFMVATPQQCASNLAN